MPTITFEKDELTKYLAKSVSDEQLREAMTMIGTDIDAFGKEIQVEIFPNRPDLLSVPGLARALNHYLGHKTSVDEYDAQSGEGVVKIDSSLEGIRPHTRCAIIRNLELSEQKVKELVAIQEKLHVTFGRRRRKVAIGIYPLEHITLPITFRAETPEDIVFQPLEADEEMDAKQLLEEHPTGKKYAHLLEGKNQFPVFRDANDNVLSVPPIINSHDVGKITADTTEVFVECSGHQEKPLAEALTIICCALADMGGTIEAMTLEYDKWEHTSPELSAETMTIDRAYAAQRAGIPEDALEDSLEKMGLSLDGDTVTIPCYRTDFQHQFDVAEDAAIGYGYNNIEPTTPEAYTAGKLQRETVVDEKIRETLTGMEMVETKNYYLTSEGVPLKNPLTQDYSALRTELLSGLLDTLSRNTSAHYPQLLYEVGHVFHEDEESETRVGEDNSVAAAICKEGADYTAARQALEALAAALGWHLEYAEHDDPRFLGGRCAKVSGDVEGVVGEVHPRELTARGVQFPTAAFEVVLSKEL